MSEAYPPETIAAAPSAGSLPRRLIDVFVAPGALFDRLREVPVWVDVLILLIVVSVASNFLVPEEVVRQMIAAQMPADAEPAQVEQGLAFARVWGRILSVIGSPITIAIVAGYAILIFNVLLGGEATYRQLFSATSHALVVYTVGALLTLGLMAARGEMVRMSLDLLVPGGLPEGYLFRFLGGLNAFSLWTCVVLGIAVSRIYPKRSAGAASAVFIASYAVLVALFAIPGGG
ncbi:MAG: YIP1 family protein [Gemmatimonadota bacterium]